MKRRAAARALAALALLATGCDFWHFDSYHRDTPVIAFAMPRDFPNLTFGRAVALTGDDANADWILASGGLGTAVLAIPARAGAQLAPEIPMAYVCGPNAACGTEERTGAALAGVASWSGATACGLTGAFGGETHQVRVRCFGTSPPRAFTIAPPAGFAMSGFGLALAAPRRRARTDRPPGEIVFVGAPAGAGRVFAAMPSGTVDTSPPGVPASAALGASLAVGRFPTAGAEPDLLLAAGAPGARSVYLLRGDPRAGRPMRPLGCVHVEEPGFGGAVALGDLDGDGRDDLVVGASAEATGRRARVHVFLAAAVPASADCNAAWPEAGVVECVDLPGREVRCGAGDAGFGSVLATGDLDGDRRDEVLIGAPHAEVAGTANAGAVWVVRARPGDGGALALVAEGALRDAAPEADDELGVALAVASLGGRDEPVVSAGGARQVLLFLCSGIAGDRPGEGTLDARCRPR